MPDVYWASRNCRPDTIAQNAITGPSKNQRPCCVECASATQVVSALKRTTAFGELEASKSGTTAANCSDVPATPRMVYTATLNAMPAGAPALWRKSFQMVARNDDEEKVEAEAVGKQRRAEPRD